jgi:hypothetical protein
MGVVQNTIHPIEVTLKELYDRITKNIKIKRPLFCPGVV